MSVATNHSEYDIVVIGGGMVGLAFACSIAHLPVKIAVVENHLPTTPASSQADSASDFDPRVSALTRASQQILDSLGAWSKMVAMRISPYQKMHVWDATGDGVIHFDATEIGEIALGHIVENRVIQSALYQRAMDFANITFIQTHPLVMNTQAQWVDIDLANQQSLRCRLLVGADGAHSFVRNQCAIEVSKHDYHQTAVVATVKTEKYHQDTAWQRFLPNGPLAFLPLPQGFSSIVWSTTTEHAQTLLNLDEQAFCLALENAFETKLGKILAVSERAQFPLHSQHASHYVKSKIALIGDAAHTIHPLAGQGVNLGFADAACLGEVLDDALKQQRPLSSMVALRRYERWRRGENLLMQSTMSGFKVLFSNENSLVSLIRNLGLNITDNIDPIKNQIMRHAMGLSGDLPKIAQQPFL